MTGLVPVIHVVGLRNASDRPENGAAWMAGTSPAMTEGAVFRLFDSYPSAYGAEAAALPAAGGGARFFRGFVTFQSLAARKISLLVVRVIRFSGCAMGAAESGGGRSDIRR
jgi:hypothetical protein